MRARELSILLDNIMKRYDLKWDYVVPLCSTNGIVWTIAVALNKISGQFTQKSSVPSTIELVNRQMIYLENINIIYLTHDYEKFALACLRLNEPLCFSGVNNMRCHDLSSQCIGSLLPCIA